MFQSNNYSMLLPDSRAQGSSGGEFVTYGLLEKSDVVEWAHWLRREGCASIYGLGESLGASILIQAAAVEPAFAAIVAESPYADLKELANYRIVLMTRLPRLLASPLAAAVVNTNMVYARLRYGLRLDAVSPVADIARTATPILLIHGLQDSRTPAAHSRALARANPRAVLWLVPAAGHTGAFRAEPREFESRVVAWFENSKAMEGRRSE